MWSLAITAIAVASVACLYVWAAYRWRNKRIDKRLLDDDSVETPRRIDGSGFELEYLMTAEYSR